jgi:pimeloyl-ACP methyl ester carboxylesterase
VPAITETSIGIGKLEWFYREACPVGWNDAKTVIFLHGVPSQSLSWTGVMSPLAEQGLRSIAFDWIGFGSSSKPDQSDFPYTPNAFISALSDAIDALDLNTFSLVVQGFVGSVGMQYAIRNPDRVEKLAILNAPLTPDTKLPWKLQQLGLPLVGEMLTQDPLAVDRTLESGCKFVIQDDYLATYRRPFLKSSDAGRSLLATIRNLRLKEALAEIATGLPNLAIPIQILWGINDPWLDVTLAETTVQSLQNANLVKLPEAAHYPQEHWYPQIAESLIPFLRRQD